MKIIETQNWEAIPEKPHFVRVVSQRKAMEVFRELEAALRAADLYPDEYFLIDHDYEDETKDFPVLRDILCYAQWGGNEGIYLEVELVVYDKEKNACRRKNFATGKTLAEDSASYDRMQYIAGYIYKLFMGEHQTPMRYMVVEKNQRNPDTLMRKIRTEYREYLMTNFVHKQAEVTEVCREIGLRSLIVHELPSCILPEDKLDELFSCENALDLLTKICEPVLEPDAFEINDMISSCDSFGKELERRRDKRLLGKTVSERLVDFYKEYDYYDYRDSLGVGETDEDAIKRVDDDLAMPETVHLLIEQLGEFLSDENLSSEQKQELESLICELTIRQRKLQAGESAGDENENS